MPTAMVRHMMASRYSQVPSSVGRVQSASARLAQDSEKIARPNGSFSPRLRRELRLEVADISGELKGIRGSGSYAFRCACDADPMAIPVEAELRVEFE